jgi:hypothetical protein
MRGETDVEIRASSTTRSERDEADDRYFRAHRTPIWDWRMCALYLATLVVATLRRPARVEFWTARTGAITVASAPLDDRYETPKGFYLRHVGGVLRLRGYWSSPDDTFTPHDVFVFARSQ